MDLAASLAELGSGCWTWPCSVSGTLRLHFVCDSEVLSGIWQSLPWGVPTSWVNVHMQQGAAGGGKQGPFQAVPRARGWGPCARAASGSPLH